MYHYVRPYRARLSERHNVLDFGSFLEQLELMKSKFRFIDSRDIRYERHLHSNKKSPIWLTFDDGYKDCIDYVLPGLLENSARATFYIPTEAIFERKLLDVNKVHILLSSQITPRRIVNVCEEVFYSLKIDLVIGQSFSYLFGKYGIANMWNDAETEFLKKLLQKILPIDSRKQLLGQVFSNIVTRPESSWVDEFYLTPEDVRTLVGCGMEVGSHGHSHSWFEDLSESQQRVDIDTSFRLLESAVSTPQSRTMCYPFGSYNTSTLEILSDLNVYTAVVNNGNRFAKVMPDVENQLELDRIDIMFFDQFIRGAFNVGR